MTVARKLVCTFGLLALVFTQGCEKKKASLPSKTPAPTIAVVLPDEIPLATQAPEEPARADTKPAQQSAQPAKTKPKKPARNSTTSAKKTSPPTSAPPPPSQPAPQGTQTVASLRPTKPPVPDAVPETAIAVSNAQVGQHKEETARMIEVTENALKGLNRPLSDEEKSMVSQVQSYLQQSRKATTEGDYERALLLAKKAQLLAEALVKK